MSKKKSKPNPKAKAKPKSKLGTLRQCAAGLHLGDRRVQQLAKEGLPKASRGRYDVEACRSWYIRYLQKKLEAKALPDADGNYTASIMQRHKMLSIETELKQIDLAKERGQLVTIEKVESDLATIVLEIKQRILQVAPRLAAEVIGEKDLILITDKIDRSLKDALVQLSKFDPDLAPAKSGSGGVHTSR